MKAEEVVLQALSKEISYWQSTRKEKRRPFGSAQGKQAAALQM